MIATILQSSPSFHAVVYNEKKVMEGCANLLEIKNFGAIDTLGYSDPKQLQDYLKQYSSRNSRIKNPQFHLAISCKGHEWTPEQLLDFAHDYLNEMGYGDPDQPLLVYSHHDTDNTHIHIITSRVAPSGKKINDSKERIRSQKAIEKLLRKNIKEKAETDVKTIMATFSFKDMRQFKSILEAMNYECFETGDGEGRELCVKKGGRVQVRVSKKEIQSKFDINYKDLDTSESMKLKAIFKKYRDQNTDIRGLEKDLRSLFGMSLVWFGAKDNPWGYQVVDFKNKKVYDGYKILHIKQLRRFMSKEEQLKEIGNIIDKSLNENPYITTKLLNTKLKKFGGYIKKDRVVCSLQEIPLDPMVIETLKRNNKIAWRQAFRPESEVERDLLCRLTNFEEKDLIRIHRQSSGNYKQKEVSELYQILMIKDKEEKRRAFDTEGYMFIESPEGNRAFVVNLKKQVLIDLSKTGLPQELYADLQKSNRNGQQQEKAGLRYPKSRRHIQGTGMDGQNGQNREWEVGKKGWDKDDPDNKDSISY